MPTALPSAGDLMTSRPVTLPFDAPISRALGLMRHHGFHEIPVLRRSRLIGMVTFETIARRSSRPMSTKVSHILVLPPLITPSSSLPEVAGELLAAGLRAAPVVGRRGELLGVISRTDLVRALPTFPAVGREPVERFGSSASVLVRDDDTVRHLLSLIRLLEEHPLPVVDRKGKLVGAIGVADLGSVLWRPNATGKKDADAAGGSSLDVRIASVMHSPPVTVAIGTTAAEAAALMTREKVSSVFVVENGRPTRVVGQADLLGLVVGATRPGREPGRVEDVYVEITGLRGSSDPALLADIDALVARGLKRVARHVHPVLFSLHLSPHSTHRTSDLTVEARLHTDAGIYYASHTGWNLMAGISGIMDELSGQAQRAHESRRRRGRSNRDARAAGETEPADADVERKIRALADPEDEG
jgi:CBS domain-containing protein/ribosome-associated translation inhibitor RaiA